MSQGSPVVLQSRMKLVPPLLRGHTAVWCGSELPPGRAALLDMDTWLLDTGSEVQRVRVVEDWFRPLGPHEAARLQHLRWRSVADPSHRENTASYQNAWQQLRQLLQSLDPSHQLVDMGSVCTCYTADQVVGTLRLKLTEMNRSDVAANWDVLLTSHDALIKHYTEVLDEA